MSSANLSTLINSDRVRSSIRRMFTGAIDEILGELFQNSQRARATIVTLTTTETGFTYEDNGHGLLGDVAGFHTLLKIAESHFDNSTLEAQDPMGLGMHALLAHEQVTQVRFESDLLGLTIDCARWWSDQAYYSSWFERLEALSEHVRGLRIVVACHPEVCERLHGILAPHQANSPALGYADLLRITLDGQMVKTALPSWVTRGTVLVETLYQGCPLTVRFAQPHRNDSAINWYGQLIKDQFSDSFTYYLHVRDGRPLHPLSPSRRGLIDDAARAALIAFIKQHLFAFLFDPANRGMIRAEWVSAYYRLDQERAMREAPYFVAAPLLSSPIGSVDDLNQHGEPCILAYGADHPLLLAQPVITLLPSTDTDQQDSTDGPQIVCYEYGRDSFLPMLGVAYTLICGNQERLNLATLWWKPDLRREDTLHLAGSANEIFHLPGSWGLSFSNAEPERWQSVTTTCVFVFNESSSWDVDQVDFLVGTSDPLAFYQDEAWAGFDSENDDYDYHEIQEAYAESCAAHIRTLIGDAIPFSFTLADIQDKMQDKRSRILSVHYHYPPRQKGSTTPIAITARNRAGQRKRLKLVS